MKFRSDLSQSFTTACEASGGPNARGRYGLFIFFMITDPKTTVKARWAQWLVVFLVAVVEMILRLAENIHAPYYALAIVGPIANAIAIGMTARRKPEVLKTVAPLA